MARQQPNHWYDCRCNACVRRRNARRRREADRYSEEGRPLPQGSQLYEIERNLPPVYDSRSMEVQDTVEHVPNRTSRPIPPANSDNYLDRPTGHAPFVLPPSLAREEARRNNRRAWSLIILLIAAMVGVIVYGVVYLDWLEPDLPVVSLPVLLPTPTPTPTRLLPTETPTPTVGHTPAPVSTPAPIATPTMAVVVPIPTEQEIVVNAFAECDGQYSGADRQFRVQAANHAIEEGRQTVVDIRRLVDEYCGGMIPTFTAATGTERPTLIKPTATLAPTPTPTVGPTPTKVPTLRPKPTPIATTGGDGRFDQSEIEAAIHQLINKYRKEQGQTEFKWDGDLAQLARAHSTDMAKNNYYSHMNRAGNDPSARARKAGYSCNNPRSIGIAENIHVLYGHSSTLYGQPYEWETQERMIQRFVADWVGSPGHRRNILDPRYTRTGIGVAFGNYNGIRNAIFVTQAFC